MIGKGADVDARCYKAGLGVIQAAEQMNVKAIGVDDQEISGNRGLVGIKDITEATYNAGKSVAWRQL